jgi:DNA replication protein DnaD
MAESFENLDNILREWAQENVEKSLVEAVNRYEKQEEERKRRFFKEKDYEKIL